MSDENHTDPNAVTAWSEMDLFDLANCVRLKQSVEEIADFLCRPVGDNRTDRTPL